MQSVLIDLMDIVPDVGQDGVGLYYVNKKAPNVY